MTKTLDTLVKTLLKKGVQETDIERRLHAGSMLAFLEATHSVVSGTTMPTPLYSFTYDNTAHNLQFHVLHGKAPVPSLGTVYINMLDTLGAALLREKMPILLEGKTGVGKTFTVEQFCKTILPQAHYRGLRLNAQMSNVLQPYTEGRVENGLVRVTLRKEEMDRIAAIFIDEVNRGDVNQVLMLQDGVVRLASGEGGELGIPVPRYMNGQWTLDTVNKRPVFVVSAQNPPATKDARYTGTRTTDAAQSNRNVQLDVPNSAASIGASALLLKTGNGQHAGFQRTFRQALARNLGVEVGALQSLDEDWISMYAFTTDPKKTSCPVIRSGIEYMDAMLSLVSPNLKDEVDYEKEVIRDWSNRLKTYGVDFSYDPTLTPTAISMEKIRKIVNSFEEEVITRDIVKVKKLADAVSLIRRTKAALQTDNPTEAYLTTPNYITVQDVACGFAIMLYDKQNTHDVDPVTIIDVVLKEYTGIVGDYARKIGYDKPFSPDDPSMSVYGLALQHAVIETAKSPTLTQRIAGVLTTSDYPITSTMVRDLGTSVAELKRLEAGKEERKPLLARMIADVSTLAGFVDQYKDPLETAMKQYQASRERREAFRNVYRSLREKVGTPDIYQHRLPRVLGE